MKSAQTNRNLTSVQVVCTIVKTLGEVNKLLQIMEVADMTANQIAYWANKEKERTNRATEALSGERNATEQYKAEEMKRNNLENLTLGKQELIEKKRSNKANERLKALDIASKPLTELIKTGGKLL